MGELSPWHWLIVLGVLVLLFGAQKLPDLARGTGQALRIFRSEMRADKEDKPEQAANNEIKRA